MFVVPLKVKVKQKLEVDDALILSLSLHQFSVLRVFKVGENYTERREVETRMWCHWGSNSRPRALRAAH